MRTYTGLALASLLASASAAPALQERKVFTEKYQGTPGSTVKFGDGPPVRNHL